MVETRRMMILPMIKKFDREHYFNRFFIEAEKAKATGEISEEAQKTLDEALEKLKSRHDEHS